MRQPILTAAIATAALLVTAPSWASIPDPDGIFHACYPHSGGRIKIIDNAVRGCRGNETEITWNEQGPPGPMGPKGDPGVKGDKGDPGDRGPSEAFFRLSGATDYVNLPQSVQVVVANLTLGAGQYLIFGQGEVAEDNGSGPIQGGCSLHFDGTPIGTDEGIWGPTDDFAFVTFSTGIGVGISALIEWRCTSFEPRTHMNRPQLIALKVGTLHIVQ